MANNQFFYTEQDIKEMKELIRTGERLSKIARAHHSKFNAPEIGFYHKLLKLSKTTRKVKRSGVVDKGSAKGLSIPDGTTFEGVSKKVQIFKDHFRIYF